MASPIAEAGSAAARWSARWINRGTRDLALIDGFSHIRFADGLVVEWVDFIDTAAASYLAGWMPEMPSFMMRGAPGLSARQRSHPARSCAKLLSG